MNLPGEDEDGGPVRRVFLPEQEAPGQAEETEGGGEQRRRDAAAEKCKKQSGMFKKTSYYNLFHFPFLIGVFCS